MSHTPGPWNIGTSMTRGRANIWGPIEAITSVPYAGNIEQANAHLIAAAPELLEALEHALRESGCDGDLCSHNWHDTARRAIKKARGED